MADAMPPEAKAMAGPLLGMLNQAGGAMFGQQIGSAIGGQRSHHQLDLPLPPDHAAEHPAEQLAGFSHRR
jgi:uncharacterized protein (DUF2342 family)